MVPIVSGLQADAKHRLVRLMQPFPSLNSRSCQAYGLKLRVRPTLTQWVRSFIVRVMILCNAALHRLVWGVDELRLTDDTASLHAVQHQAVQVNVEIGDDAKALYQRDRAAVGFVRLKTSLPEQVARDHPVHHLQHRRYQLGLCG
jgi:hypothetical protein